MREIKTLLQGLLIIEGSKAGLKKSQVRVITKTANANVTAIWKNLKKEEVNNGLIPEWLQNWLENPTGGLVILGLAGISWGWVGFGSIPFSFRLFVEIIGLALIFWGIASYKLKLTLPDKPNRKYEKTLKRRVKQLQIGGALLALVLFYFSLNQTFQDDLNINFFDWAKQKLSPTDVLATTTPTLYFPSETVTIPVTMSTQTPSNTPTKTTTPTTTPFATDQFNDVPDVGGAMWMTSCGVSNYHDDNRGQVYIELDGELTQCWLQARVPAEIERIVFDLTLTANITDGYAGIRATCGNTDIGFFINSKTIDLAWENLDNSIYARGNFLNRNIRLSIQWQGDEKIILEAFDLGTNQKINPIIGFENEVPCTDFPKQIFVGGQVFSQGYKLILDYAELAGVEDE